MLLLLKIILSYLQVIFYQYGGSDLIISNVISKLFYFFSYICNLLLK